MDVLSSSTSRLIQLRASLVILVCASWMALLFTPHAVAVDGYKEFKFGMTPEQVKKKSPVLLEEVEADQDTMDLLGRDTEVLQAEDFPFLGNQHIVTFTFTKKGLALVTIVLEDFPEWNAMCESLDKKYGKGTLHPNPEGFKAALESFSIGEPSVLVRVAFDKETIVIMALSDAECSKYFNLVYFGGPQFIGQALGDKEKDDL